MADLGYLTVAKAQEQLTVLANAHASLLARVDQARHRIHEFAAQTRDYQMAERGLTLNQIDAEFYAACQKSSDPSAMAARFGVPPEVVAGWASQAPASTEGRFLRLVIAKDGQTQSFAMGFSAGREAAARELLLRFMETQGRYGWQLDSETKVSAPSPEDTIFADA